MTTDSGCLYSVDYIKCTVVILEKTIQIFTKDLDINGGISCEGYELEEYKKYYGRVLRAF